MVKKLLSIIFVCLCLLCSACGPQDAAGKSDSVTSVANYNFFGEPINVKVKQAPQKILVCGNSGAKTLLALGAGEQITAVVLTDAGEREALQKQLPQAKIYTQPLQLEAATLLAPDFILGWRRYFADNQLGDTTSWIAKGVPAYIQDASGPIPAKGKFPACTIASEQKFIRNMGLVTGRTQQAEALLQQIDTELQVKTAIRPQKVLFVEFLGGNIEVFGDDLLSGDIVRHFGSSLITYSAPFISQEELMTMEAEKIFVVYHGDEVQKNSALAQLANPLYQHIPAVQQGKIYPINYNEIVAPRCNLVQTLRYIRQCLEK
ncbi:ABC transporter substrate-binding protein [Phascolarctobacterium sp.]